MLNGKALRIELHRGSQIETFEVHADRALLGSGSHCDVRVRPAEAAFEQLAFELHGDVVLAAARSQQPPCMLNGVPFSDGRLLPGAILEIGQLAIVTELVEVKVSGPKRKERNGLPPALQLFGLLSVGIGLYYALQETPSESAVERPAQLPRLFGEQRAACPQRDPTAALALAEQSKLAADVKRERAPFYAGDGVLAVPLYDKAAACYALANDPTLAGEAEQAARELRTMLSDELRVRQVRLERFLAQQKYDAAQSELHVLRDLVRDRSVPYAQWLVLVQREIDTRFASSHEEGG
jgi:hypothetical protein